MNDENFNEDYGEDDIDEMLDKIQEVKSQSSSTPKNKIVRRLSLNENDTEQISVRELRNPYVLSGRDVEGSFYNLMRRLCDEITDISKEDKYQSRKLNKIHIDMLHLNDTLSNISTSLYIDNLIQLYSQKIIDEFTLVDEIRKVSNINLSDNYYYYGDNEDESQ